MKNTVQKKSGLLKILTEKSRGTLYVYIAICTGCALAMLWNLWIQGVGFSALHRGVSQERELLLLTVAVVAFCILADAVLFAAATGKK